MGKDLISANSKHFDAYIVSSTFARALVDVFIPVIMYKNGYSLHYCILYYMVMNLISFMISYPLAILSKNYSNRILAIISIVFFIVLQFLLLKLDGSLPLLYLISFVYAVYKRCYWMSRRFYTLHIVHKKHVGTVYAIISILHQLSVMAATYIGAILLDGVNQIGLIGISTFILLISLIPLFRLNLKHEKNSVKLDLRRTLSQIPAEDMLHFGIYELWNVLKFIFPIYIAVYVKDTYQAVGIVAIITDLAIIIFSYLFGKRLDASNKDFLRLSIFLVVLTYLAKANSGYLALMIVSFIEGFTTKMFEISLNRNSHLLSKKFEYNNYNLAYEMAENFIRLIASLLLFVLPLDLRGDIYLVCGLMFIGCLFKFKIPKISEYDAESAISEED
jgi:hypothetical protein